jgi:hypothetical protein
VLQPLTCTRGQRQAQQRHHSDDRSWPGQPRAARAKVVTSTINNAANGTSTTTACGPRRSRQSREHRIRRRRTREHGSRACLRAAAVQPWGAPSALGRRGLNAGTAPSPAIGRPQQGNDARREVAQVQRCRCPVTGGRSEGEGQQHRGLLPRRPGCSPRRHGHHQASHGGAETDQTTPAGPQRSAPRHKRRERPAHIGHTSASPATAATNKIASVLGMRALFAPDLLRDQRAWHACWYRGGPGCVLT